MAFNKSVQLDIKDTDKYGRSIAIVTVPGNPEPVNLSQIRRGMAWAYRRYAPPQTWVVAEEQARSNKVGLWTMPDPVEPEQWRHNR